MRNIAYNNTSHQAVATSNLAIYGEFNQVAKRMDKDELINKSPTEYAEKIQLAHAKITTSKHKKERGQFFTSKTIANFMGNLAHPKTGKISILDPGCGTAILSCALIETLVNNSNIKEVDLTLFETDQSVILSANKVMDFLHRWLQAHNITLNLNFYQKDFVLYNADIFLKNTLFENTEIEKYDYIISNPPYFKISKSDNRAQVAKDLVYGQPNIYSIFMGVSAKLLKPSGELIFITPRSFAAGNYFRAFRQSFFRDVSISNIHIFNSRTQMFKKDSVLQENIIIKATKDKNKSMKVSVSDSENDLNNYRVSTYKTEELIDLHSEEKILFIPSNAKEAEIIKIFKNWHKSLNDYNIQISTGPVVAFRCAELLVQDYTHKMNIAPLFWLHNIKEMEFVFPLKKGVKPSYIIDSSESKKVLLENKNYIFIRRFSSKDDKCRLICSPYFASSMSFENIAVENHLNYIYRPNGVLSDEEIWGISALFNSTLFDTYFRTFNGNTQVGAFELKQIKMPSINKIILIGEKVKRINKPKNKEINNIINEVLLGEFNV